MDGASGQVLELLGITMSIFREQPLCVPLHDDWNAELVALVSLTSALAVLFWTS